MSIGNQAKGAGKAPADQAAQALPSSPAGKRIAGIDAARALAMIGMLAVHVGPEDGDGASGRLYALAHGRASILFILVAGIGIALLSSRPALRSRARQRLFWFAVVLLPLGLALQLLDQPIAVILHHYAAFFLLGIAVLGLPRRTLLLLAAAATLIGPGLYFVGRMNFPGIFDRDLVSLADDPLTIVGALLVSGPYPLLTWSAPLLWGIWLGRQDLRSHRNRTLLCLAGLAVAILAAAISQLATTAFGAPVAGTDWRHILADTPHSQMPLWVLSATGSAMFVLGATLIVVDRLPALTAPFSAFGQLALTMYVAHVLVLYWWRDILVQDRVLSASLTVALMTAIAMVLAMLWRTRFRRGPIEMLMHLPWELMDRTLAAPPAGAQAPGRPQHARRTAMITGSTWRSTR